MARQTRASTGRSGRSTPATPMTETTSPIFSRNASATPMTAVSDDAPRSRKRTRSAPQSENDDEEEEESEPEPEKPPPARLRVLRRKTKSTAGRKASAKAPKKIAVKSDSSDLDDDKDNEDSPSGGDDGSEFELSESSEAEETQDYGSEAAGTIEADEDDDDEDEPRSSKSGPVKRATVSRRSSKLDYDEPSSDDDPLALTSGVDLEADEQLMLDTAIEASLMSARGETAARAGSSSNGAGSSTSRSPAAALRAAAAERRLRRASNMQVDDDEDVQMDSEELDRVDAELSDVSDSDEEEAPKPKSKSKGKTKKTTSVTRADNHTVHSFATLAQARAQKREEKKAQRVEERALAKKLGRKLTQAEKTALKLYKHHPELRNVWGDVEAKIPVRVPVRGEQPPELKISLLPFQLESLDWMRQQEEGVWKGGMLADEMGMGKTIQMISLLVHDRCKPNLVVAPTVAVIQWQNEILANTRNFKVYLWHGQSREQNIKELQKYDVVLTTFAVLESAYRKETYGFKRKGNIVKERSALHAFEWKRIILDEAHNIKERSTNTAKAAFALKGTYKWCLSGTPLQNRVGELYSLVRFLGGDPFSYYFCKDCDCKSLTWKFINNRNCVPPMQHVCLWNSEILNPIQKHGMDGPGSFAFKKLRILLDRMMLRRTKLERADDLGLPPRTVVVRRDYFSEEEKELYMSLFSDAKRQFSTFVDSGTILNNYSNIFSLITRMRQMACHPDLVLKSKRNDFSSVDEGTVCRLCNDIAEDAIQSKCRHIFDRECIKQYLNTSVEQTPACPVCHLALSIDLEAPALELEESSVKARQGILGRLDVDNWRSSSKIEALLEELTNLRRQDATTKSIVFSQFVNFLDLIAFRLQRAGFNICRLEGTMSPQARDATIKHFMNNVEVTVFLVSLKAGGVALNLTEASRVYLVDSWWNPAVEFQAMDRIHRLGQHRPVQAIKLVIEDSIESRIVQLQEKKSAMYLNTDDAAMGRLTPEDVSATVKWRAATDVSPVVELLVPG
ncbi:SNF2 family N-terminal domain-containing protein [Auriculariales sp. MPI-PUGE-AT-0066]|nr:SNF2 family N-terminal domain-containing protein [Auriculariales sp. MPI-PUGE-AT-0066]